MLRFFPHGVPRLSEVRIDWGRPPLCSLISILTGLFFGLAPLFSPPGLMSLPPFEKALVVPVTAPDESVAQRFDRFGDGAGRGAHDWRWPVCCALLLGLLSQPGFNPPVWLPPVSGFRS